MKLASVGTRTDNADRTAEFFRTVLGLGLEVDQPGLWKMQLPDGSKVEVFGPGSDINPHFTTGPVAGFLVDDLQRATEELQSANVEILFGPATDPSRDAWVHFRARMATFMSLRKTLRSAGQRERAEDASCPAAPMNTAA